MTTHWINLTSGLQAIRDYGLTDYRVMRLQSTHCEQHHWDLVLASIPDELLFRLALGQECVLYDYGARKACPRSFWQGMEFLVYCIHRRWYGIQSVEVSGRAGRAGNEYFEACYRELPRHALRRLDYYGEMAVPLDQLCIRAVSGPTDLDGQKAKLWRFATGANYDVDLAGDTTNAA